MTKQEATVIEMYTGVCMLTGDDRKYFYEYAEKLLGHPIMTHEYPEHAEKLKELSKPDFLKICESVKNDGWIPVEERPPEGKALACDKYGEIAIGYIGGSADGCYECEDDTYIMFNVIAWHPLPEPYQPEAETQRPEWQDRMLHTFLGGHHD